MPERPFTGDARMAEPLGRRAWLVPGALALHILEEWPRFPEWATRHFGTTTPRFFAVSHVPIVLLVGWSAWRASGRTPSRSVIAVFTLVLAALATNTMFHLGATLLFREYSPGVITALAVYGPVTLLLAPALTRRLGRRQTVTCGVAGAVVSGLVTATLLLDIPF